jgi:imidazolonepropionase-like amidohydrolase
MTLAIRDTTVFDGRGKTLRHATIVIEGEHITSVGEARRVTIPRGATRIDGRGLTVIPGLMDCHVHLCLGAEPDVIRTVQEEPSALSLLKAAKFAQATLEAGFTTVRDLGFRDHSVFALRQAIHDAVLPGPRVLPVGLAICMTGGHARFIGREADGPVEVIAAVREQLAAGAEAIKFIASGGVLTPGTSPEAAQLTLEELKAGVGEARRAGRRVAAHAHSATGMKNAVRAGVHSIEHGTLLDEEAAALLLKHGVFIVPTLSALATTAQHGFACGIPESVVKKAQAMRARHEASFKQAYQSGVLIAMGTDAGTPFNYHGDNAQELERMVALGMTPAEAIQSATHHAAILLGVHESLGTLEPGKQADLLVVDGNPLRRIGLLRRREKIAGVMRAGRFVSGPLKQGLGPKD